MPNRVGAAPLGREGPPRHESDDAGAQGSERPELALGGADYPARRGALVGVILGGVIASALAMATFIWYRWQAVNEPTTAVIVEGDATLDGTVITVAGARVVTTRLSAANNYVAPVLLEPGWYLVTAKHKEHEVLHHEVEVRQFLGVRIKLADVARNPRAATTLSTGPGTP